MFKSQYGPARRSKNHPLRSIWLILLLLSVREWSTARDPTFLPPEKPEDEPQDDKAQAEENEALRTYGESRPR